jgi:hypothetical protein
LLDGRDQCLWNSTNMWGTADVLQLPAIEKLSVTV